MPAQPGLWENFACWVNPGGMACHDAVQSRLYADSQAMAAQVVVFNEQTAAAAAQQGYTDAVSRATVSQVGWSLAMILPPLVIVGLGVGAYLVYRRKRLGSDD